MNKPNEQYSASGTPVSLARAPDAAAASPTFTELHAVPKTQEESLKVIAADAQPAPAAAKPEASAQAAKGDDDVMSQDKKS